MTAEHARLIVEQFTGLMEMECATTCKVLGAVGTGDPNYRPDPKSRTSWELARHIATSDIWFLDSIIHGAFNFDPAAAAKAEAAFQNVADVVSFYGRELPARLQQVRAMSADDMTREVDFFGIVKRPAVAFLGLCNNHSIHHRGQLAAYLRAMGSKVPSLYGGSADEPMQ